MSLNFVLLIVQYISIALSIFLCAYISRRWSKPAHGWLFFYCVSTLVNNAGYLVLMNAQTEREALLIWQFTYICRAWIPFTLLKFCLYLCTGKRYSKITSILAHVHVFVYLMVLTMSINPLFYSSYRFVQDGIFPHFELTPGILHYIYDAICLGYVFVVIRLLLLSIIREKDCCRRRQFIAVSVAIFMVILSYIAKLVDVIHGYDESVIGFTLGAFFLEIAIFAFGILDVKNLSEAVVVTKKPDEEKADEKEGKSTPSRIEAFGDYDKRIKLPLTEILYFEADAEQVFAYTIEEIYNVKLRLYQVESISEPAGIIRVSKSHLINVQKIESVRPALNSRLYVKMLNGEEVLVSRKYAHALKEAIA